MKFLVKILSYIVFIGIFIGIFSKEILGEQIGDIIIGISKSDLKTKEEIEKINLNLKHETVFISSVTEYNLNNLNQMKQNE